MFSLRIGFEFDSFTQLLNDFDGTGENDHFASTNDGPQVSSSAEIVRGPDVIINSSNALGSNFPADDGTRAVNWKLAIDNFASSHTYGVWWQKLLVHCYNAPPAATFEMNCISFLNDLSHELKPDGSNCYRPTTLVSALSVMKKGALHCCNIGNLSETTPQLSDFVGKLLKTQQPVRKAAMFSVLEISNFLDLPDTPQRLIDKVPRLECESVM